MNYYDFIKKIETIDIAEKDKIDFINAWSNIGEALFAMQSIRAVTNVCQDKDKTIFSEWNIEPDNYDYIPGDNLEKIMNVILKLINKIEEIKGR